MTPDRRERAINAPMATLLIAGGLGLLFVLQSQVVGLDAWNQRFGLTAADLTNGRGWTLISYMGAHASWAHVGMNAVGCLAFGAPLARRLGDSLKGVAASLGFFLMGGVFSGLIFTLINLDSPAVLVGASGGVFALIGAATRLMNPFHRLEPILSRRVLTMTAVWVGTNLLVAVIGADPATGVRGVAWEAHLIGLFIGLFLVGPWLAVFSPRPKAPNLQAAPAQPVDQPENRGPKGPWG